MEGMGTEGGRTTSTEDDPKETWAGGEQGMFLPFRSGIALGKAEGEIQRAGRHECRRKESIIRLEGIQVPGLFLGRPTFSCLAALVI